MQKDLYKEGYTQNRELSWLRFNERCLNEARDKSVPLLERMKFVAIFSSNLDEFFSVRAGSLTDQKQMKPDRIDNKSGLTAEGQLKKIYAAANRLCDRREDTFKDLKKALKKEGIEDLGYEECTKTEKQWLKKFFAAKVEPLLGAQIVDSRHPLPPLLTGVIYTAGVMKYQGAQAVALVPVPGSLQKIIRLPGKKGTCRFVHTEDLILANMETVFKGAVFTDRIKFVITRNADVHVDDDAYDEYGDYRDKMAAMLKKRKKMDLVRIEVSRKPEGTLRKFLVTRLRLRDNIMYVSSMPLDRKYMFGISDLLEAPQKYLYEPYEPKLSASFNYRSKLFAQVQRNDVLLSYPYESMDAFLLLLREAAKDPAVTSIRITIYRLAKRAKLVDYLCLAAENGKEVVALIELKARFDEQNNIDYSERLLDAGCTVMYGFTDYKVHSKICLISRMSGKTLQHTAVISTGNFNENTAKQYTDLMYMTADPGIVKDSIAYFHNMMTGRLDGRYSKLLVSPVSLKSSVLKLIDREIAKGENGRIIIKENSITDEEIIVKLKEASCAGVRIDMIIRGICCILPQVKGKTENLHVRSIVGRYLEHSRIYVFGSGRNEKMYLSSADFMTRNTERRVEIAVPVVDAEIRKRIHVLLGLCFADNVKAREMSSDGKYHHIHDDKDETSCQDEMMKLTPSSKQTLPDNMKKRELHGKVFDAYYREKKNDNDNSDKKRRKKTRKAVRTAGDAEGNSGQHTE